MPDYESAKLLASNRRSMLENAFPQRQLGKEHPNLFLKEGISINEGIGKDSSASCILIIEKL